MKPDDKPKQMEDVYENPKLYIVIDDKKLPRPGLETAFVDYPDEYDPTGSSGNSDEMINSGNSRIIGGVVCSCNKVRVASCGCVGYTTCGCVGDGSSQRSRSGCQCAPVY